jgi:signal transduction histidine kinase
VSRVTTLGELTASIAHEVNQPLAGIVTNGAACLRWLGREPPELDQARRAVESMINDGKRASEVVSRLRALSKKTDPQRLRLDLNEVIDEVILLFQRELLNNRVALRLELASALPPVLGDRIQLQQVLMNLLINAIQAMAPVTGQPREVLIRSRRHDANQVVLEVMDSGIGITPENADRLFSAFFTTKPDGMGIGLSICRSIIEAHGGRIWASPNTGPGATLQFTLPLSEDNAS